MLRASEYLAKSLKVIETGTIRKLKYGFLFIFHSNYGCILYHFRDKARYWLKISIFSYPVHSTPRRNIWYGIVYCLPDGEKSLIYLAVSTQYRRRRHRVVVEDRSVAPV